MSSALLGARSGARSGISDAPASKPVPPPASSAELRDLYLEPADPPWFIGLQVFVLVVVVVLLVLLGRSL